MRVSYQKATVAVKSWKSKKRRMIFLRYLLRQGYEGQERYGGQGDDRPPKNGETRTKDEKSEKNATGCRTQASGHRLQEKKK